MASVAIFGIGNVLLGDDGVGPAVARFIDTHFDLDDDVIVEDLGTPSLSLPGYLTGHDVVVFVDAVASDQPPGTILRFTREEIMAVEPGIRISPHEPSINDALIMLDFAGGGPRDVTLIGIVPGTLEGGMSLSAAVAAAVPQAAEAAAQEGLRMKNFEFPMKN
ncbi:MAG: hydrogenase maturation protease [Thermoanaerobaculia bacterium]